MLGVRVNSRGTDARSKLVLALNIFTQSGDGTIDLEVS